MNVLRDDIPTELAAFEDSARLREPIHKESRRRQQDRSDHAGDGGHASPRAGSQAGIRCEKRSSRSREHNKQYIDSQPSPMQLGAIPKSKGEGKESKFKGKGKDVKSKGKGKEARFEPSKKTKNDDQRKCQHCNETGHRKSECRKRLKDFADAEGKLVAASPHHSNDTATVKPLQCLLPGERHTSTFVLAMPHVNSQTLCEFSSGQTVRNSGAGSIVPTETTHVQPIAAIPSKETHLMMDTCAGASIFQVVLISVRLTT